MRIDQGCNAGAAELTASLANELVSGRGQDQGLDRPKARALISSAAWAGGWVNKALTAAVLRLASKLRHGHLTLVLPDGSYRGTIGGGEMEGRVIAEALDAMGIVLDEISKLYQLIDTELTRYLSLSFDDPQQMGNERAVLLSLEGGQISARAMEARVTPRTAGSRPVASSYLAVTRPTLVPGTMTTVGSPSIWGASTVQGSGTYTRPSYRMDAGASGHRRRRSNDCGRGCTRSARPSSSRCRRSRPCCR